MKIRMIVASAIAMGLCAGCAEEPSGSSVEGAVAPDINAEIAQAQTRTCINPDDVVEGETVPVLWKLSDELGVFTDGNSFNVKYVNSEGVDNVPNASFSTASAVNGAITHAYYPYSQANDGRDASSLTGSIPSEQAMDGNLYGDYKYGTLKSGSAEAGYTFKFHNLFSMVYFKINPAGTALAGEKLESVTLSVTRDGASVPVTGDFTFSAVDGLYEPGEASNVLNTIWNKPLDGTLTGFATVFSEILKGDKLNFTFKTTNYEATLTVTSGANFQPGAYYAFPLTLSQFKKLQVRKKVSGTFTAATYNVDGLPNITINLIVKKIQLNETGPLSAGTTTISKKIAADNWDFVGFSASSVFDFIEYDNEEFPTSYYMGITSDHWATDGLSFAGRKSTCSFEQIAKVTYPSSAVSGGLTSGANESIDKGYRHFLVTLKDGTELDVIITHMNTYSSSGSGHINAQHAQLTQIAEYINSIRGNKRPIIFMGDTNCRYTRHDFKTYFWDKLNSDLVYKDPWVEFQWDGVYPTYGGKSLMVSDATGTDSKTDIICENTQKGEVVDKIIYINNPDAPVQIKALNYLRDYNGYQGLADHMPIVAKFSYEGTIESK